MCGWNVPKAEYCIFSIEHMGMARKKTLKQDENCSYKDPENAFGGKCCKNGDWEALEQKHWF